MAAKTATPRKTPPRTPRKSTAARKVAAASSPPLTDTQRIAVLEQQVQNLAKFLAVGVIEQLQQQPRQQPVIGPSVQDQLASILLTG